MRRLLIVLLAAAWITGGSGEGGAQIPRHLAAPPEDIRSGRLVLPEPAELSEVSRHAVLTLPWERTSEGWSARIALPVDGGDELSVGLVGFGAAGWRTELGEPGGRSAGLAAWAASGGARLRTGPVTEGDLRQGVRLDVPAPRPGRWGLEVTARTAHRPDEARLVVRTGGATGLRSHVATHRRTSERRLPLVVEIVGGAVVDSALVHLETFAGDSRAHLFDDGRNADGEAADGILGAWLGPLPPGPVRARVEVSGTTSEGTPFVRTQEHAFTVERPAAALTGSLSTTVLDAERLAIAVGIAPFGELSRLHLSAEVWGPDASGEPVPVAWLSHIGQPAETHGATSLALHLDGRWLARAGTTGPLELRRVRLQDPDSHVVYDAVAAMPLPAGVLLPPAALGPAVPVTPAMLLGAPPPGAPHDSVVGEARHFPGPPPPPPANPALMLSHGYCSGGNIWPAVDFSEPKVVFLDPDQNRSNDEFAQLLAQTGTPYSSFGFVGHSQGGLAALHLLTYYSTGLDQATGPRRIQSVASPYQGTPLASLGSFACGVNDDMTTSGAPLWLAGIPTWARQEVYYWTTQNSGSVCNFLTDLVLGSPNDGTVERDRGQLPGATNMGHVSGWCHTTGMSDPANYLDHVRNMEMDAQAAR